MGIVVVLRSMLDPQPEAPGNLSLKRAHEETVRSTCPTGERLLWRTEARQIHGKVRVRLIPVQHVSGRAYFPCLGLDVVA